MSSIYISVSRQELTLHQDGGEGTEELRYTISTAANGVGFDEGSYCTPTGRFEISEKIGDGEKLGTIFSARQPAGQWEGESTDEDLVLTRIIRLQGLESENANTMERYIYIHGTNQESMLGSPVSHGCIRMSNRDMIELFDHVKVGDLIQIR